MNSLSPPVPGRILLADDEEPFRRSVARTLTRHGFACVETADAAAAVGKLQQEEFDLLISDIYMPGNERLELIRQVPQVVAGLPIILLTGQPTVETAAQSLQLTVTAYLTKPPNFEELVRLAQQAVIHYRAYRAVHGHHQRLNAWCHDMDRIKALIKNSRAADTVNSWQAFLSVSLDNLIRSMGDLKDFTEVIAQPAARPMVPPLQQASPPLVLTEALRETIAVLEKTKSTFKSKELGDLRKRLERLLL